MAQEKTFPTELGTIGGHTRAQQGGNDPQTLIDQKTQQAKVSPTLSFPEDLPVHQFLMIFYQYNFNQGISMMKESIVLPMPPSIVDKYGMEYNTNDLGTTGAIGASAADMAIGLMRDPSAAQQGDFGEDEIETMTNDAITFGTAAIAQLNPFKDQLNAPLEQALGGIANPHTAILFQSMKLKEFEFTWKLYPQSKKEQNDLNNIIHLIKTRSHPSFHYSKVAKEDGSTGFVGNNAFLKYPHEVDLYYLGGSGMHKFKRAVINNLSINYTPEGGLNFNAATGAPSFIEITIGFTETQIWTAEDFGAAPEPIPGLGESTTNLIVAPPQKADAGTPADADNQSDPTQEGSETSPTGSDADGGKGYNGPGPGGGGNNPQFDPGA